MTPPWTLLLGAPISAHSFPFPLWTKLRAGSSHSPGLSAFACQLEGMLHGYGKDAEKTATFAHGGFLSAYQEFVLSESCSCYPSPDALQDILPKALPRGLSTVGFTPGIPGAVRSREGQISGVQRRARARSPRQPFLQGF